MMYSAATARSISSSSIEETAVRRSLPRVLVADDCEEVVRTVATMLQDEFEIVGLAKNGQEVLDLAPRCSPDIMVLDLFMPLLNGLEAAAHIKATSSPIAIVIITVQEDLDYVEAATAVGVRGYVLKPYLNNDLIPAIWAALKGNVYVSSTFKPR